MIHDSTWPAITRATRWLRLLAPVGFLLTCVLLAALPAVASATTPEMRGEWELTVTSPGGTAKGVALISTEANGKGEFAASSVLFSGVIHGTFSGTLEGSTASVTATAQAYGPAPASEFTATNLTVESSGPVSISGKGTLKSGANTLEATFTATRIKTYKEIEEREAKEKQEQEEREARETIRGEWELVVSSVAGQTKGTALITEDANSKNEFASSSALVEHLFPGSFSGTLEGAKASVTVIAQTTPAAEFISKAMTVESHSGALSMSGSGTLKAGENTIPATLVATRIKTYTQLKEAEAKEKQEQETKAEQEAKEKAEQEAKAKAEQEAKAKAEQEAKAKAEQEAKAKAEREAKEKAEREAIEKHAKEVGGTVTLLSAEPMTKTITAAASGALSLGLSNPNSVSVQGHVTMTATVTGKAAKTSAAHKKSKAKTLSLGSASFTISAHAHETVKISLSHSGRTELARLKTLRVQLTIVTDTSGEPNVSKVYTLTLRAAAPAHRRR